MGKVFTNARGVWEMRETAFIPHLLLIGDSMFPALLSRPVVPAVHHVDWRHPGPALPWPFCRPGGGIYCPRLGSRAWRFPGCQASLLAWCMEWAGCSGRGVAATPL